MDKIDLIQLLDRIGNYVLIKKPRDFPSYRPGSDIDLLVPDRNDAIRSIHAYFDTHVKGVFEMRIHDAPGHCHIDFVDAENLNVRVDIIDNFDFFTKFTVKPGYIFKLFQDRRLFNCEGGSVYVPSDEDDLTIRYFEYLEWFDLRPDKIGHLEYICAVRDEGLKGRFFDNTHRYVQLRKRAQHGSGRRRVSHECLSADDAVQSIRSGAAYLLAAVFRRASGLLHRVRSRRYSRIERVENIP